MDNWGCQWERVKTMLVRGRRIPSISGRRIWEIGMEMWESLPQRITGIESFEAIVFLVTLLLVQC